MKRVVIFVALVACGHGKPSRPPPEPLPESPAGLDRAVLEKELTVILALTDRACACDDTACLTAVEDDLIAYNRVATYNDPVTNIETWPEDIDAIANASMRRLRACMEDRDFTERHDEEIVWLRKSQMFRDDACACDDAPCAERVRAAFRDWSLRIPKQHVMDPALTEELEGVLGEMTTCLGAPLLEQAMLDLRAIREAACACTDDACAEAQRVAMEQWMADNARTKAPQASLEQARAIADEISSCLGGH